VADADTRGTKIRKLAGALFLAGALAAAAALPFVGGAGLLASRVADDFNSQSCALDLSSAQPAQKTEIVAANGQPITYLFRQNREVVPAGAIPAIMREAIVSIEDRRFYQHHGVDVQSLLRAVVRTSSGDTQGASTLTQQYVKQLALYSATSEEQAKAAVEQTAGRKLKEARCAVEMEKRHNKDQILTGYLNIANFGAGAYGVKVAARTYFNRTPAQLTLSQAALLAGLVQSPTRYNPFNHPQAAQARRHDVLQALLRDQKITAAQADQADADPLPSGRPRPSSTQLGCANAAGGTGYNTGFFCDYVIAYLQDHLGLTEDQLYTGGYKVTTTLDPTIQLSAQTSLYNNMVGAQKATAVLPIVDNSTGEVKAMAVSKQYGVQPGQTVAPLPYKAMGAGAGSVYKVFTMIAALKRKVPLQAYQISTPGNTYTPTNCPTHKTVINAGSYADTNNLEVATYQSINTFFEALIDQKFNCDLSDTYQTAVSMGLDTLDTPRLKRQIVDEQQISFTLGPDSTNPLEMAGAFATLANDGKHCPPTPVVQITDSAGRDVGLRREGCKQVLDPAIAHTATYVLEKDTDPGVSGNTAKAAHIPGYATAGKTGTTQNNASVWFIGYTPQLSGAVAIFDPLAPSAPLPDVPGYAQGHVFGGGPSAHIWHDALAPIMQKYPQQSWPPPDQGVIRGNAVPLPSVVGMDVGQATSTLQAAGFTLEVAGNEDSTVGAGLVSSQSPSGYGVPGQTVRVKLSTGNAPAPPPGQAAGPGTPGVPGGGYRPPIVVFPTPPGGYYPYPPGYPGYPPPGIPPRGNGNGNGHRRGGG
jgi:membrane peptidoglycan carboxypeptidase